MNPKPFVSPDSIVRKIWGQADMILFIFAGSAAEFSLNKDVDWLYFTGKLPSDPLGRMFSTVAYARSIIWMEEKRAINTIATMKQIHHDVEKKRMQSIPDTAYRDVLYMLIAATIKAHEVLESSISLSEKEDIFEVFIRMGNLMGISDLPETYNEWENERTAHLSAHLKKTKFTTDLFTQFRKHLGYWRYQLFCHIQYEMSDKIVRNLLQQLPQKRPSRIIMLYKLLRDKHWLKRNIYLLMPFNFRHHMKEINTVPR